MKLQRLRLTQIRRFREPLEIPDFAPGLNLFTGPNEAGKSTVVRAIRAAFFERYRSSVIDDLIPRGESPGSASPTIELQFESGGIEHRLAKTFFSKKRFSYQAGAQAFDGEAAEEAIATLLGFSYPGKGVSKAEHWGIPGLLWVQQGDSHEIAEPVRSAAAFLRRALESTVGAVASTGGDQLLATLRQQRDQLLTPGGGKPRADFAEVIRDLAEAREGLADLDRQIADYRASVDRLEALRRQQAADDKARPWQVFGDKLDKARADLAAARQLVSQQTDQEGQVATVEDTIGLLDQQLQGFQTERDNLVRRQAELAGVTAAADEANRALTLRDQQRARAHLAREAAGAQVVLAEREAARRDLAEALKRATDDEARIGVSLGQAEQHAAVVAARQAEAEANRIDEADLKKLERSVVTLREREITLRAAATAIRLDLTAGQAVRLDGAAVPPASEHRITARARLDLAGIGIVEVTPGEGDGAELARQVEIARAERDVLLARIGVPGADEAQARKGRFDQARRDATVATGLLAAHAPQGIDALRAALARARQIRDGARRQLDAMTAAATTPGEGGDGAGTAGTAGEAGEAGVESGLASPPISLADARDALKAAIDAQQLAADDYSKAASSDAKAHEKRDGLARTVNELKARVEAPATRERELEARTRLDQARTTREQAGQALAALRERIAATQPDVLEQDVRRLEQSRDQARAAYDQRAGDLRALESRLEMAGATGLESQRAELVVTEAALARRRAELDLRARALDLLVSRMEAKRQALTTRLQAPLTEKLTRYLRLLFPAGAQLALADDLTPGELDRGPADTVDFGQLSHGAREQLALISRLAYADLLKEAGKPTLIVLDDALVHSDGGRIEQMQRVLFDAASRHQILVFSCHPERWAGLGVAAREITSFQASYIPA